MPKDCCALQNVSIEIEQEEENRQFKKKKSHVCWYKFSVCCSLQGSVLCCFYLVLQLSIFVGFH